MKKIEKMFFEIVGIVWACAIGTSFKNELFNSRMRDIQIKYFGEKGK